jgi:glycosyltransferase involved in cell wall biosynthesis
MISVVVPVYNVESYLAECLDSLLAQTVRDLEVVIVNDGSTDGSAAIAEQYVARDPRFRVVTQENGGLSKARNAGIDAATGDYLAFLDSDDRLPPDAYRLLLGALEQTGSEFATGNVHRLSSWGTWQSHFLAEAFTITRLRTHVTRDRPLLADRTAWNKLWRRSFWGDRRFPEGVVHEDIPVILPAHFAARSVDALSDPVYFWRTREGGELSITQRRLEPRVLLDRLAAIEQVCDYLEEHGPPHALRWYRESVVADDLGYHLDVLDRADDGYRELFLDRANEFLGDEDLTAELPDSERRKWDLVRRRALPELLEILRHEHRTTVRMRLTRMVPTRYRRGVRRTVRALKGRSD